MTVGTVSGVRGRARRAASVLVVLLVLAACVPPPDQPIGGTPSYSAQLTLSSYVCAHPGTDCFYQCNLTHYATWDLGYETVFVTGRVGASGCSIDDWQDILVTATCWVGSEVCGGPWVIPAGRADRQELFNFNRVPAFGVIRVTLAATNVHTGSGSFTGDTPPIRCSVSQRVCKFQT